MYIYIYIYVYIYNYQWLNFFFFLIVCIKFLTKFGDTLSDDDRSTPDKIKEKLLSTCKNARGKDERFVSII